MDKVPAATIESDVYAFGLLAVEVCLWTLLFLVEFTSLIRTIRKILSAIRCFEKLPENLYRFIQEIEKGTRPLLAEHAWGCTSNKEIQNLWPLLNTCWDGNPTARPTITQIKTVLYKKLIGRDIQVCTVGAPN